MKVTQNLLGAIVIAKSIIDNNPEIITTIQHDRTFLGTEPYVMANRVKLHLSVKSLIPVIKKVMREETGSTENIDIKFHQVNTGDEDGEFKGSGVAGIMIRHSANKYAVLLNENESYCTQRLSVAKELAEVYVDYVTKIASPALDPYNQIVESIEELLVKFFSATYNPKLTEQFKSSEWLAHAIALELMIPYTLRGEIKEDLNKGIPVALIAKRLFIPLETLEEYLKKYFDLTTYVYERI
jgi:hypothetical protein